MIGRVVRDVELPLREYIPDPVTSKINPKDIVSDISEDPVDTFDLNWVLSRSTGDGVRVQMTKVLNAHAKQHTKRESKVTSAKVKRYMMSNIENKLERLMEDKRYKKDVEHMLKTRRPFRFPLLVTGMLTCEDTTVQWGMENGRSVGGKAGATGDQIGAPGMDMTLAAENSNDAAQNTGAKIRDEVVFALAYDTVRVQRYLDWQEIPWKFHVEKRVKPGQSIFGEGPNVFSAGFNDNVDDEDTSDFFLCSSREAVEQQGIPSSQDH